MIAGASQSPIRASVNGRSAWFHRARSAAQCKDHRPARAGPQGPGPAAGSTRSRPEWAQDSVTALPSNQARSCAVSSVMPRPIRCPGTRQPSPVFSAQGETRSSRSDERHLQPRGAQPFGDDAAHVVAVGVDRRRSGPAGKRPSMMSSGVKTGVASLGDGLEPLAGEEVAPPARAGGDAPHGRPRSRARPRALRRLSRKTSTFGILAICPSR